MSKELIKPEQFAHVEPIAAQDLPTEFSNEQISELDALYQSTLDTINTGKLIKGIIISLSNDGVIVDINYKSDGIIPRYEFADHEFAKLKVGDEIEVILDSLESVDGAVSLSYEKAKSLRAWDAITKLFEENQPLEGTVTHKVKGGLSVDIGVPAFLPGSQIDLQRVDNFDQYVGQTITALVIKINKKRGNVIISRRKYLNDLRGAVRKQRLETLEAGQTIEGTVKNITRYGAFVDLGDYVDGLLYINEMTWGRVAHPSELVKVGDKVTVLVLDVNKETEEISLSMKKLTQDPWLHLPERIKAGDKIDGIITRVNKYGLFVQIEKDVEGLVHISEISWTERIDNLEQRFQVTVPPQKVRALVVNVDPTERRISLSIKQLEKSPWESVNERFFVGQVIEGRISNITDFGIFVQLMLGVDGLIHISDLSWTKHINHPRDLYPGPWKDAKTGELLIPIKTVIVSINKEERKIALGIKQLKQDPWQRVEQEYIVGNMVEGRVSQITQFGVFVELENKLGEQDGEIIEGFIHPKELSDSPVERIEDVVAVGDVRTFKIIGIAKNERRVNLSLRSKAVVQPMRDEHRDVKDSSKSTTGRHRTTEGTVAAKNRATGDMHFTSKAKSALQLELERHAARQQEQHDSQHEEPNDRDQSREE